MSRRVARELALRALYSHELSGNSLDAVVDNMINRTKEEESVKDFAARLLRLSTEKKKECDELVTARTHNWDFERIAIIDKLILRLAVCEFLFFEDIPPKVSIDEAIEVAKKYSTEKSGQFINGILDGILLDLKEGDLLQKTGRGLQ